MNGKKITSMIFKTLNYTNEIKKKSTNGHGGRRQLFKSLRHSLRIPASQPKKLEWFDEQSHLNLIWLPESGTMKLDDFPKEKREALLAQITDEAEAPTIDKSNRAELIALRAKLKNTVKNASRKETEEGSILAFQNILNVQGVADTERLLSDLDQFDIKRKSQKLDTARQFLDCHNEIERGPKPLIKKNQAVIQEAFFKFPSKNEVSGISSEAQINLIKDFYKTVFPNYPIHFIVLHGDEDADLKDYSDHPHIFISTKSTKTGRYDLRETQINKVNSYLKKHRPGTTLISEKPDFLESQLLFGYLQDMFYAFTNNRLLKETPYTAKKHEKTESHMKQLRYINGEARKPKSEREFSLYQLAKEKRDEALKNADLAKKQALNARDYARKAEEQRIKAEQAAEDATERHRLVEQATAEERELAEAYQRKTQHYIGVIDKTRADHAQEQAAHAKIKFELKLFRNNMSELIDGITNWIEETFAARRQDIQDKYLERARKAYERVRENDKSEDGRFTKKAEAQVDTQLAELELYDNEILDMPSVNEVRRKIIKPR
ncbi:hypothetical protein P7I96_32245 [Pseudomonas aeruginosa]|uniref:hypothetical protein n=1 Tax=Pseudomonas aeruginosa TaxID=287 RepID=UPI00249E87AF|nr:hypothetical protein [Pseudomonas aeruginosa]EIZ0541217.1 hypothetical protein [Pseudomonas aeruginosa]WGX68603.1 hypothetical protein P7I96_32245 [Pseudomonas aeruginosa]